MAMSETPELAAPDAPVTSVEPPPAPPRRRPWLLLAVVGLAGMLLGALVASGAFVVLGSFTQPKHSFDVTVFLDKDVSAAQKAAVESTLKGLDPPGGVRFETRAEAWRRIQKAYKDYPSALAGVKEEHMPETFHLVLPGRDFDCATIAPVWKLPGVDDITIVRARLKDHPGAIIKC